MIGGRLQNRAVLGVLAVLSGCATNSGSMLAGLDGHDEAIELTEVAFHPQVTDQCGPAALATILNSAGVETGPDTLRSQVYIPEREGAVQLEMLAATRRHGRIPYPIDPDLDALLSELHAGRPVLILQNLGAKPLPIWHYAVVVGYLPDDNQFVLRSGDRKRHRLSPRKFLRAWQRADYWGIVALRPGELPANPRADEYLRAVAAVEATGDTTNAVPAYRAATERWPENQLAWLGLGNAAYTRGEIQVARNAYLKALEISPGDAIALNNLSQVYVSLGCRDNALETINSALNAVTADDPLYTYLHQTLAEVKQSHLTNRCVQ